MGSSRLNSERLRRAATWAVLLAGVLCGAEALAADLTKSLPKKKITVPPVQIAYKNDRMSEPLPITRENQHPGVIVGDALNFVAIISADMPQDGSRYSWSGTATGEGVARSVPYNVHGDPTMTLSVFDRNSNQNKFFVETTRVRFVGPEKETDICPSSLAEINLLCSLAVLDANSADEWAESGEMATSLGFTQGGPCTADDGKCNAAKHSYWNLLMVRDTGESFAARLATAHERLSFGFVFFDTGLDAGSAHNSVVMDLDNNAKGRNIARNMTFETSAPNQDGPGKAAIVSAVNGGAMTKLDPLPNPNSGPFRSSSFLTPSDQ